MKKNLLILFGGASSEYEVSLASAAAVVDAVDPNQYHLLTVGITRMGQWLLYRGPATGIANGTWAQHPACVPAILSPSREDQGLWVMEPDEAKLLPVDVCFPVLHGKNGEDGTVQGLLELAGIPFVGCGCASSALCMDKATAHALAQQAGFICPRFATVHRGQGIAAAARSVEEAMANVPMPWFVKPAREGSSFGITKLEDAARLEEALKAAFAYDDKVVVEEGIDGFEVGCAVLGGDAPVAGMVDAIHLVGGFFNFHEKYNLETAEILLPAPLGEDETARVQEAALALYRLFGCRGLARVDLFYTSTAEIVFNEINTLPGMTAHSRYPGMLAGIGIPFAAMVDSLIRAAEVHP